MSKPACTTKVKRRSECYAWSDTLGCRLESLGGKCECGFASMLGAIDWKKFEQQRWQEMNFYERVWDRAERFIAWVLTKAKL